MDAYKEAGVDIDKGNEFISNIKEMVSSTRRRGMLSSIGGFSGLFNINGDYKEPVMVTSTDGVGTKLAIANMCNKHDTVGIDLVAMCVNDIVVCGAEPVCFLDYFATGFLDTHIGASVIKGIVDGCKQANCALIGGETAEMPDMYKKGDYDLAGFSVGLIDRENIIDGSNIKIGDVVIGLQSSGLHSNGYSLVRKLLFKDNDFTIDTFVEDLSETIGAVTLRPTRIYVKSILSLIKNHIVHAIVHNTGGGLSDNIARVLPKDCCAVINKSNWEPHAIFSFLQDLGNISENDMFKTFNMGIGMVIVVPESHVDDIVYFLDAMGEICYIMGEIIKNNDASVIFTK